MVDVILKEFSLVGAIALSAITLSSSGRDPALAVGDRAPGFNVAPDRGPKTSIHPHLAVGDRAPGFNVAAWISGDPSSALRPGVVKVVEFWATWCVPCRTSIPELNRIATRYRGQVEVIGVASYEEDMDPYSSIPGVEHFLDSWGDGATYLMGVDSACAGTARAWMSAAGKVGIPTAFVVDRFGKISWIGHPAYLEDAVAAAVNGFDYARLVVSRKELTRSNDARQARFVQHWVPLIIKAIRRREYELANRLARAAIAGNGERAALLGQQLTSRYVLRYRSASERFAQVVARQVVPVDSYYPVMIAWEMLRPGSTFKLRHPEIAVAIVKLSACSGRSDPFTYQVLAMAYEREHLFCEAIRSVVHSLIMAGREHTEVYGAAWRQLRLRDLGRYRREAEAARKRLTKS